MQVEIKFCFFVFRSRESPNSVFAELVFPRSLKTKNKTFSYLVS